MSGSHVMDRASLQVGLARTSVRIMLFQDETTLSAQPSVSLAYPSPASAWPYRVANRWRCLDGTKTVAIALRHKFIR